MKRVKKEPIQIDKTEEVLKETEPEMEVMERCDDVVDSVIPSLLSMKPIDFFEGLSRYQPQVPRNPFFKEEELSEVESVESVIPPPPSKEMIHISFDQKRFPWLKGMKEERVAEYLEIGYRMSQLAKMDETFSFNMDSALDPMKESLEKKLTEMDHKHEVSMTAIQTRLTENLERVQHSMDKFSELTQKSSFKGMIGEGFVESLIQQYFPDDIIENTSKKTAESDYHMKCQDGLMILIESKFYGSVVGKSEIEKFKRDLVKTGFPIGIFISFTSGIVGKKRFEIERMNEHQMIIYIPNASFEGSAIIWSVLLAKEWSKWMMNIKLDSQKEKDLEDLHEVFDSFHEVYQHFSNMKLQILDTRNAVMKHMDDLYHKTLEIHIHIQNLIGNMKIRIQRQMRILNEEGFQEGDVGNESIEKMRENGEDEDMIICYQKMLEMIQEKGMYLQIDGIYEWFVYMGQKEMFHIKNLTKKKEIVIPKNKITMLLNLENLEWLHKLIS